MKPSRRQLIVFTGAVLIALPMFWMGFIERRMIWLLPGVGVVVFARIVPLSKDVVATDEGR